MDSKFIKLVFAQLNSETRIELCLVLEGIEKIFEEKDNTIRILNNEIRHQKNDFSKLLIKSEEK